MFHIKRWRFQFILFTVFNFLACRSDDFSHLDIWNGHHHKVEDITIHSFDATPLKAHLYTPRILRFPGPRPVVIFANSWTVNEYEYTLIAKRLAEKGFIVLSYSTRGFGGSGGFVEVASYNDIKDFSGIIDWLLRETRADKNRIFTSGVSYGGGIALLAAARDERIKGVVSMSAWADLFQALYGAETIRNLWLQVLIGAGNVTGRLSPELSEIYKEAISTENFEYFAEWAYSRSPVSELENFKARCIPIFLSNNYQDDLFPPNQVLPFLKSLKCSDQTLYINHGIHATSEIKGILGFHSPLWDAAIDWLFEKAYEEDKTKDIPVQVNMEGPDGYEVFNLTESNFRKEMQIDLISLNPIKSIKYEEISASLFSPLVISVNQAGESGATTGIPIVSGVIDSHTPLNIIKKMSAIDLKKAVYLQSKKIDSIFHIRGVPAIKFTMRPHLASAHFVAYLYQVNPDSGKGRLISHGVRTLNNLKPFEPRDVNLEFKVTYADLKPNERLAVVIDSYDSLYKASKASGGFDIYYDSDSKPQFSIQNFMSSFEDNE